MDDLTLHTLFNGDADAVKHYKELRVLYEDSLIRGESIDETMELADSLHEENVENDLNGNEPLDNLLHEKNPNKTISKFKFKPEFRHSNDILYEKDILVIDSKQTALSEETNNLSENSDDDLPVVMEEETTSKEFTCGLPGCSKVFTSLESYESHYHSCHHFVCSVCRKAFVSDFMLQIHLEENHDSYFSILCTRIDMYRCFIESCTEKFRTSDLRRDHCVKVHHLPANFGFHKPLGSQQKGKKNKKSANQSMEYEEGGSMKSLPLKIENAQSEITEKNTKKASYSVPMNICFGRGSQKVFEKKPRQKKRINVKND